MTYYETLTDELKGRCSHNVDIDAIDIDGILEFLEEEDLLNKKGKEFRIVFEARYIADDPLEETEDE